MWFLRQLMTVVLLFGILVAGDRVRGAESDENAALVYWQAFALLPSVDDDLEQLVQEVATVKLDQRTEKLVDSSKSALACMRRAAAIPDLDWGLEFSAGPHMVMPHLSKARQMARYACLHARQQLADGDAEGALETIHDTFVLARHIGADDVLISLLVQYAVEKIVIDTVCQELPNFDAQQLDTLSGYLDSLPQGGSVAASMKMEQRTFVGWARRVVREAKTDQEAAEQLRGIVVPADQAPDLAALTRKQINKLLDGTMKDYDEIQVILDLPDSQFQPRWDRMMERIKKENSYSSVVLPALGSVRVARDRQAATWAVFRAAIAIQRDGQQRVASTRDPFGEGPFSYKKLPSGFRLSSQFKFRDKQVELTIGPTVSE